MGIIRKHRKRRRKASGQRQTLAKQIRELAQMDTFAAALLAERGRQFSKVETLLNLYYHTLKEFRIIQVGQKTTDEKLLEGSPGWTKERAAEHRIEIPKSLQKFASQISQILIDAVNAHESGKIIEIAKAVEFLKQPRQTADLWRYQILMDKMILDELGRRWTIGKLARSIGWPESDGENGFPQLRRLCKELDFPLSPSR